MGVFLIGRQARAEKIRRLTGSRMYEKLSAVRTCCKPNFETSKELREESF
jgi:hypothetical protein